MKLFSEDHAQRVLKDIYDNLHSESDATLKGEAPIHHASESAGMFLVLRKLSKAVNEDERKVTLRVLVPQWFKDLRCLKWSKEVAERTELKVKLMPTNRLNGNEHHSYLRLGPWSAEW